MRLPPNDGDPEDEDAEGGDASPPADLAPSYVRNEVGFPCLGAYCEMLVEETEWTVPASFEAGVREHEARFARRIRHAEPHVEPSADAPEGLRVVRVFLAVHEGTPGRAEAEDVHLYVGLPDSTVVLVTIEWRSGEERAPVIPTHDGWRTFLRTIESSFVFGRPRPAGGRARVPYGTNELDGEVSSQHLELTLPEDMFQFDAHHEHGVNYAIMRLRPLGVPPAAPNACSQRRRCEAIWISPGCSEAHEGERAPCRPRGSRTRGRFLGRPVSWVQSRVEDARRLVHYDEEQDIEVELTSATAEGLAVLRAVAESARLVVARDPE